MKPFGLAVPVFVLFGAWTRAADATSPVDYRQRNTPFAPTRSVAPATSSPEKNSTVEEKRVEKMTVDLVRSPVGERRAPVDVKETREKHVREKESRRPETVTQPTSAFNHRAAAISTNADTKRPPMVAKYQDSLAAASASNMAHFPAMDRATTAKLNRFVFRRNPTETSTTHGVPVTPAGGSSMRQK